LADQLSALVAKRKFETGKVVVRSWAGLARELLEGAGLEWDEPTGPAESDLYFGEVVPSLMRDIALDHQFEPRFDALVVDEAQDQDTCWRESESDEAASGGGKFTGDFFERRRALAWLFSTTRTKGSSFGERRDSTPRVFLNVCRNQPAQPCCSLIVTRDRFSNSLKRCDRTPH
jgi:hypothetical protein